MPIDGYPGNTFAKPTIRGNKTKILAVAYFLGYTKIFVNPTLGNIQRNPAAQTAHLVFADTKANAEKPKELFFANARTK